MKKPQDTDQELQKLQEKIEKIKSKRNEIKIKIFDEMINQMLESPEHHNFVDLLQEIAVKILKKSELKEVNKIFGWEKNWLEKFQKNPQPQPQPQPQVRTYVGDDDMPFA